MNNCGNCKFFGAEETPSFARHEKQWVWAGKCTWDKYPIPAAAVRCWRHAHMGKDCPTWEQGEKDYVQILKSQYQDVMNNDETWRS